MDTKEDVEKKEISSLGFFGIKKKWLIVIGVLLTLIIVGAAAGGVAAATAKKKQDASHEVSVVGEDDLEVVFVSALLKNISVSIPLEQRIMMCINLPTEPNN